MNIDIASRQRLQTQQTTKTISDGIDKLAQAIKGGTGEGGQMVLANEFRELRKVLSEEALVQIKALVESLDQKISELSDVEKNLPRKIEMNFPEKYPVEGTVNIGNAVTVSNPGDIAKQLAPLLSNLQTATFKAMQSLRLAMPSKMTLGEAVQVDGFKDLLDGVEELKKGFNLLINKEAATVSFPSAVLPVEIQNWMIPQPVTNVSINPNRGTVMATAVTVTTSLTPLPGTALADRRSMTIYNNSAATTIYVGGANVTSASGIPVPAGTYGPSMDAGPRNIVYAVTASGSADIRVLELNDLTEGGDS